MLIQDFKTEIPGPYSSLEQAIEANQKAGRSYFGAEETRLFGSCHSPMIHGRFFIETCLPPFGQRIAKVVLVDDEGYTHSVGFPLGIGTRDNLDPTKWFKNPEEARKALDSWSENGV